MRKAFRITIWVLVGIITLVTLLLLYIWFIYLGQPEKFSTVKGSNDYKWYTVKLDDTCMCSEGSDFRIFFKKGKSDNLLIHFSGGGACWDDTTCSSPTGLTDIFASNDSRKMKSFYFPAVLRIIPKILEGIEDNDNDANPFKDWNIIFIPYCTGDLHVGNTTNTYKKGDKNFEIHHNGRKNTLAVLNWVYNNFNNPGKIMVSGESAGAYASAFWAPAVAAHYDNKTIYQLSDGSLLQSRRWPELMDTIWKSESSSFLNFNVATDVFEDALLQRKDSINKRIHYLHSNTIYDEVLPLFSAQLNHLPVNTNNFIDTWSADTRASMKKLANAGIDYHYYLSDCFYDSSKHTTPHTLTNRQYYKCASDGLTFAEWLRKCVIEDKPVSVGSRFLNEQKK